MKTPNTLVFVRHAESDYNALKAAKAKDPLYTEFKRAYGAARKGNTARALELAEQVMKNPSYNLGVSEADTPLNATGVAQARSTGARLSSHIDLPDVVLVSPFLRCPQTLDNMIETWPKLGEVPRITDSRLQEQAHGTAVTYNDWRVFHLMYPEEERKRKMEGAYNYRYPEGENIPDLRERTHSMQETLNQDYRDQRVMIVGHHLSKLAFRANYEGLGATGFTLLDRDHKPDNCGISTWSGTFRQGVQDSMTLQSWNTILY